ncbi:hypothetical protein H0O03_00585 [Candidatus Micrarchaeota archaeon]|nr:hypothetical protein [Candidatus Micrarchaeota archaeon]
MRAAVTGLLIFFIALLFASLTSAAPFHFGSYWLNVEAEDTEGHSVSDIPVVSSLVEESAYTFELSLKPNLPQTTPFLVGNEVKIVGTDERQTDITHCFEWEFAPKDDRTVLGIYYPFYSECQYCGLAVLLFNVSRPSAGGYPEANVILLNITCNADVLIVTNEAMLDLGDRPYFGVPFDYWISRYINRWNERRNPRTNTIGNRVRYVDLSNDLARQTFGISDALDLDAEALDNETSERSKRLVPTIRRIRREVDPGYLILLGGMSVIPVPFDDTNSAITDRVYSDDLYSMPSDDSLPNLIVSRFPTRYTEDKGDATPIVLAIDNLLSSNDSLDSIGMIADRCGTGDQACWNITSNTPMTGPLGSAANSLWQMLTNQNCSDDADELPACLWSPPACVTADDNGISRPELCHGDELTSIRNQSALFFLEAHGATDGGITAAGVVPARSTASQTRGFKPVSFGIIDNQPYRRGAVVVADTCFGGFIATEEGDSSFPFNAIEAGAKTIVGVFGASFDSGFYVASGLKAGQKIGAAVTSLKKEAYLEHLSSTLALTNVERYAATSTMLYGDPYASLETDVTPIWTPVLRQP